MRLRFTAEMWEYPGEGAWHFVTVPADVSDEVRARSGPRRGFGSVRVQATIGETTWSTSVFPSKPDRYLLPVKRGVRAAEDIADGDTVDVLLELAE